MCNNCITEFVQLLGKRRVNSESYPKWFHRKTFSHNLVGVRLSLDYAIDSMTGRLFYGRHVISNLRGVIKVRGIWDTLSLVKTFCLFFLKRRIAINVILTFLSWEQAMKSEWKYSRKGKRRFIFFRSQICHWLHTAWPRETMKNRCKYLTERRMFFRRSWN